MPVSKLFAAASLGASLGAAATLALLATPEAARAQLSSAGAQAGVSAASGAAAPNSSRLAAEGPDFAGMSAQEAAVAKAILRASASHPEVAAWYEARSGKPMWSSAGGALDPETLLLRLEDAPSHALPAAAYSAPQLRARLAAARGVTDPEALAALDLDLSRALTRYAGDMSAGILVPSRVDSELHIFPERPKDTTLLAYAAAAPDLGAWLDGLAPADPSYDALRATYARLSKEVAAGGWRATLSQGGTLRVGDSGPRVAQLRARLAELGEPAPATAKPEVFDAGLEAAVQKFQRSRGLNDDGLAGQRTFAALGANAGQMVRQVAANLERMRWAPEDMGEKYIVVNQADYTMRLYDHGDLVRESRVVVGQPRHRTPEFVDRMTYLVVNPTWHVPRSIATKEILPSLRKDPTYLERNNMRLVATDGGPVPMDTVTHDWSQYDRGYFPYAVKQEPGNSNSLGRVKFMFPNQFNIYLHDTPSKRLFRRDGRAFSHGCVRVEDPFGLAYLLLAPQLDDPQATFQAWLDSGRERRVNLKEPVMVNLTYRTAWVDEEGREQFREDVYGRDEEVWAALEAKGLAPVF